MITEQEKNEILQSILDSPDFRDSKRNGELLQFLFAKSFLGEDLKETTLAHEFFGRDTSFDPGHDSFVRTYISNLRKKIEHYYLTVTGPIKYKISIPKGQYNIQFVKSEEVIPKATKFKFTKKHIYASIGGMIILVIAGFFYFKSSKPGYQADELSKDPLLSNFVGTSSKKTIIALGDYFFYTHSKNPPDGRTYIRNANINNELDFNNWINNNPDNKGKFEPLNFTYLRPSANMGLISTLKKFKSNFDNFDIRTASSLKWQDFEKSDIIYIGSLKTLYILDTLLSKTNFRYNSKGKELNIIKQYEDSAKSFHATNLKAGRFSEDYSVIMKIPLSNHNSIIILGGFGEVGILGSVRMVLEENFHDIIKKKFNISIDNDQQYFLAISKVKGVNQTVFDYTMESFDFLTH